jgi:hypothetical protein
MPSDEITPDSTPPAPPRFDAEPFRPDGAVPPGGLALLLGGVALTALALGFVLSFVGQWFYLPIIFPIFAAMLLGGAGRVLVRAGKVRSPGVAGLIAALGGLGMMFFMHYFDCLLALNFVNWQAVTPTIVFRYIDWVAQSGVVIGEDGNNGVNLGYVGSYIYFALEAVLATGFALVITKGAAAVPFCRGCNVWKQPRTLAGLPHVPPTVAVEALRAGALLDLLDTGTPTAGGHPLNLKAAVCPRCGADGSVVAAVEQITIDSRGRRHVKVIGQYVYPGQVLTLLDQYAPQRLASRARRPAGDETSAGERPPENPREDLGSAP